MYFKQILDEHCGCASYVIASRESKEAAIVDPSIETQQYDDILRERGFRLKYVIDTHVHADHVSGARRLAQGHGADVCLHESANVAYSFVPLRDNQELQLGQLVLRILHTPGHRPELISVTVVNPPRSPEPSLVLTGDSLLVGDVGRPDFGGGNATDQYASLTRLLRLPDWVAVFPGHFEGPCGKGMCGRPSTTIGFERLYNPLARMEQPQFVSTLGEGIPARPLNMVAIEATNRGVQDMSWAMLTTYQHVDEVTVDSGDVPLDSATIVDVREPGEYERAHVPAAINIPQAELATRLEELPRDRTIVTICQSGGRSLRAAQFLKQVGFERVVNAVGGTTAWDIAGKPLVRNDQGAGEPVADSTWAHAGVLP